MAIRFKCPHCQKSLSVKDEFAGKKGSCPACKKGLTIPAPASVAADVEDLAAAALREEKPAAAQAPKSAAKVDFTCPHCDAQVQFDEAVAGKQAPCPECRRIVRVPQLAKEGPVDWRRPGARGPSGARREAEPAPEGAWGSPVVTRGVSEAALVEAGVIAEEREPWSPKKKVLVGAGAAFTITAVAAVVWMGLNVRAQSRQDRAIAQALQQASTDGGTPKLGPARDAAIHLAAGEYYLRTGQRDCAPKAREHFATARTCLGKADPGDSKSSRFVSVTDHDLLLLELALAQLELGGEGDDVERGRRLKWDTAQGEAEQSLRRILLPDVRAEAVRAVCRSLIGHKQERRAGALAGRVSGVGESDELLAVAGLELLQSGNTAAADRLAQDALHAFLNPPPPPTPDNAARDPLEADFGPKEAPPPKDAPAAVPPASLVALLTALDRREATEIRQKEPSPVGYAQGLAHRDLPAARDQAARAGQASDQFRALVGIAAARESNPAPEDLDKAAALVEGGLRETVTPGQLRRLMQLGARAGSGDRMEKAAREVKDGDLRAWAQLELIRARLAGSRDKIDPALADGIEKGRLAHALALLAVARHNAKHEGSAPAGIDGWEENLRAFGHAGAALGMQDRRR